MRELEVHVIRAEAVREADVRPVAELLPSRYEQALRFRLEHDRLMCLGAGLLLLEVLGIRDEREISYGRYGKPYVADGRAFSISHSGSVCVLACGDAARIGADIEAIDEQHVGVAPAVYTEGELAWMRGGDPIERFFRLWTWKECVMKATGMGMSLEPRSFEVLPFAEGRPVEVLGTRWYAQGRRLDDSLLSVCADEPIGSVRLIEHN